MARCPNGHISPDNQFFCGECGLDISDTAPTVRSDRRTWVWIMTVGCVVVMAAALVAYFATSSDGGRRDVALQAPPGHASGGFEDWMAAACNDGRYRQTGSPSSARWMCRGTTYGAGFSTLMFITQYQSDAQMRAAIKASNNEFGRATCESEDGSVIVFVADVSGFGSEGDAVRLTTRALEPLDRFGCVILRPSAAPGTSHDQTTTSQQLPPAIPVQPAPTTPGADAWAFQSPTGNIVCHMSSNGAACDIARYDYVPPARPESCAYFGDRFALDHGGKAFLACHTTNFLAAPLPTQRYDVPLTSGSITCTINEQTGVTCRDGSTGHFFQVAMQSYQLG